MKDELGPLVELTRFVLDSELAKLRRLSEETRRKQDEINRLGDRLTERLAALGAVDPMDDVSFHSGQDARWQAWVAQEKKRLSLVAAELASRREAQRVKAQRAFGRVEALKGLREVDAAERAQRAARRLQDDPGALGNPRQG